MESDLVAERIGVTDAVPGDRRYRVRLARTQTEIQLARRLWYEVYVEEMGRHLGDANHKDRLLGDPRDEVGRLIVAVDARGEIIGTVLCTLCRERHLGFYEPLYQMDRFAPMHPMRTSIGTKLIVSKKHRRAGRVFGRLMQAAFCLGLLNGIRYNAIDCREETMPVFLRMGFREHIPSIRHPLYGTAHCLAIDLEDRLMLAEHRSPFLPLLDLWRGRATQSRERAEQIFRELTEAPGWD